MLRRLGGIASARSQIHPPVFPMSGLSQVHLPMAPFNPLLPIMSDDTHPAVALYYQALGVALGTRGQTAQLQMDAGREFLLSEYRRGRGLFVDSAAATVHWTRAVQRNRAAWSEAARCKYDDRFRWQYQRTQVERTGKWALDGGITDPALTISLQLGDHDIDIVKTNLLEPTCALLDLSSTPLTQITHLMSTWMHPIHLAFANPSHTARDINQQREEYAESRQLPWIPSSDPSDFDDLVPVAGEWMEAAEIRHAKASGLWDAWAAERAKGAAAASRGKDMLGHDPQ